VPHTWTLQVQMGLRIVLYNLFSTSRQLDQIKHKQLVLNGWQIVRTGIRNRDEVAGGFGGTSGDTLINLCKRLENL